MKNLHKILALVLSFSLVGQGLVFAAPQNDTPKTLAQYQQRAKEDIKNAPWLTKEGKYLLAAGGVTAAVFIVREIMHKKQIKSQQEVINYLASVVQAHVQIGRAESNSLKDLRHENKKLKKIVARQDNTIMQMHGRIDELHIERNALQRNLNTVSDHYGVWASYPKTWSREFEVYEKMFDQSIPLEQRLALKDKLAAEPWVAALPKEQKKQFLHVIETGIGAGHHGGKVSASSAMRYMGDLFIQRNSSIAKRLIAFSNHVFNSKNLLVITIFLALGMSANDVKAQRMANRINVNFDLFLNATPQELKVMEQDEEIRKVCIQGAEVLHQMSQMSKKDFDFVLKDLPKNPTNATRVKINLAR